VIARLEGVVVEKGPNDAIVDVQGVGYRVYLSLLTLARLPEVGARVSLRIRTVVREDAFDLFGFLGAAEEQMFLLLTSVSHVGPKLALTVMSGLDVNELAHALGRGELARLTKIHGVGKKTAERLVLELKDKAPLVRDGPAGATATRLPVREAGPRADLVSALVNLGYKPTQAEKAAEVASDRLGVEAGFELLFREALKGLRAGA
jgi:Holliday junction DNA helicase RuvA